MFYQNLFFLVGLSNYIYIYCVINRVLFNIKYFIIYSIIVILLNFFYDVCNDLDLGGKDCVFIVKQYYVV